MNAPIASFLLQLVKLINFESILFPSPTLTGFRERITRQKSMLPSKMSLMRQTQKELSTRAKFLNTSSREPVVILYKRTVTKEYTRTFEKA
jgi:hypothetical protein